MQNDVFIVTYKSSTDNKFYPGLVITNLTDCPFPVKESILNWYADKYDIERERLDGYWLNSIDGSQCPTDYNCKNLDERISILESGD